MLFCWNLKLKLEMLTAASGSGLSSNRVPTAKIRKNNVGTRSFVRWKNGTGVQNRYDFDSLFASWGLGQLNIDYGYAINYVWALGYVLKILFWSR